MRRFRLGAESVRIEWLDPAPADRSRDGCGTGTMRLSDAPDRNAFLIRDGDPAILEGVEDHVERTERGLRFVPKRSP